MANIIALIWDFDRTLIDGYMQDPMFEEYGVDKRQFWDEVN
ncbi:MAG TPA: haloacid dehalogenase-like hydrolase, partial [Eubacterium sp.]|nr:haloacid dehalogenase-like hydrolase [Eubacterium sp.]